MPTGVVLERAHPAEKRVVSQSLPNIDTHLEPYLWMPAVLAFRLHRLTRLAWVVLGLLGSRLRVTLKVVVW